MLRYLRLYRQFLQFSFSRAMEFRLDFFFRIVMDLVYYMVNIAFFRVIYGHTPSLAGWTQDQTMLFVAIFLVVDAIHMTVFTNNLWFLPQLINSGSLDYYLTRPVSSLFFLSLREFAANSFINLIMAFVILVWALHLNLTVLSAGNLLMLGLLMLNGVLLHYLIAMIFIIPVFWTHSGRGFGDAFQVFSRFTERPDRLFTGGMRIFLTYVLPMSLIASFPARLFLEAFDAGLLMHLVLVTGVFILIVRIFWAKGLKAYSSASS